MGSRSAGIGIFINPSHFRQDMDANELRELAERLEGLQEVQEKLEDILCEIDELNGLCAEYGLEGSHHADIEYGRSITQCEEAIREIENLR